VRGGGSLAPILPAALACHMPPLCHNPCYATTTTPPAKHRLPYSGSLPANPPPSLPSTHSLGAKRARTGAASPS